MNKATGSVAQRRPNPENLVLVAPSDKKQEEGGGKTTGDAMVLSPSATPKPKAKGKETPAVPTVKVGSKGEDSAIVKAVKDRCASP